MVDEAKQFCKRHIGWTIFTVVAFLSSATGLFVNSLQIKRELSFGNTPPQQLMGWAGPEEAKRAWDQVKGGFPKFKIANAKESSEGKVVHLWDQSRKTNGGKHLPTRRQLIGDCVGAGHTNALDYLQCVGTGEFKPIFENYHYACGRVIVGKGQIRGPDGSVGAWQVEALKTYGAIPCDLEGLPEYNESSIREWAVRKPADKWITEGKKTLLGTAAQVTTYSEARDAIANGYPVTVCSNRGFQMQAKVSGGKHWGIPSGQWNHCFKAGTMVDAYPVPKPIEQLQVGDSVFTHTGRIQRVSETMKSHFDGDVVTLRTTGSLDLVATDYHPVLIYRPMAKSSWAFPSVDLGTYAGGKYVSSAARKQDYEVRQPCWTTMRNVAVGDYLLIPQDIERKATEVPSWPLRPKAKKQPVAIAVDADLAFFFGYYIANGNIRPDHGITLTMPKNLACKDRLVAACGKLGIEPRFQIQDKFERIFIDSVVVSDAFEEWFGKDCETKHIPQFLFTDKWDLLALLDGYASGDGCKIREERTRTTTVSYSLAQQVWMIAVHLGQYPIMGKIEPKNRPGAFENAKVAYSVEFGGIPKRMSTRYWSGYYCIPVRGWDCENFSGTVYNCEVPGDNSFIADGYAVHNCMVFIGVDDVVVCPSFAGGGKGALYILNTWGPDAHGAPAGDEPPGGFWVSSKVAGSMLAQEDSFALSDLVGFPARDPDWNFSAVKPRRTPLFDRVARTAMFAVGL